jgi:chemotaxis protein histidine kinase CheA
MNEFELLQMEGHLRDLLSSIDECNRKGGASVGLDRAARVADDFERLLMAFRNQQIEIDVEKWFDGEFRERGVN